MFRRPLLPMPLILVLPGLLLPALLAALLRGRSAKGSGDSGFPLARKRNLCATELSLVICKRILLLRGNGFCGMGTSFMLLGFSNKGIGMSLTLLGFSKDVPYMSTAGWKGLYCT